MARVARTGEPLARSVVGSASHDVILPYHADHTLARGVVHNGRVTPTGEIAHAATKPSQLVTAAPPDAVLAAAVDLAREAALSIGTDAVGEHLGVSAEGDRIATHAFASLLPGYSGWYWAVTLARAPRSKTATVDEVVMLPGLDALRAPAWVPWAERLRPGDLGPGDLLPPQPDDPRLVSAYVLSDDPAVEEVAFELGLGRERVMSRDGRLDAADRWYAGDTGPDAPMARQAPAPCGTCGFLLPLAGSLRAAFGVCGNEITATDGRLVSVEFGCGAHSQLRLDVPSLAELTGAVYDDTVFVEIALEARAESPEAVVEDIVPVEDVEVSATGDGAADQE